MCGRGCAGVCVCVQGSKTQHTCNVHLKAAGQLSEPSGSLTQLGLLAVVPLPPRETVQTKSSMSSSQCVKRNQHHQKQQDVGCYCRPLQTPT